MAHTINHRDIHDALHGVKYINDRQRDYLKGVFTQHKDFGGVDRREFERTMKTLKRDHNDQLNSFEIGKVHDALSPLLDGHHEEEHSGEAA